MSKYIFSENVFWGHYYYYYIKQNTSKCSNRYDKMTVQLEQGSRKMKLTWQGSKDQIGWIHVSNFITYSQIFAVDVKNRCFMAPQFCR